MFRTESHPNASSPFVKIAEEHISASTLTTSPWIPVLVGSTIPRLHTIVEQIFEWAESRSITLSAQHIKGLYNVETCKESRVRNLDAEWMLQPHIFKALCQLYHTPDVALFATRINAQLAAYVSWKPDLSAIHTNAFTMNWTYKKLYAFPPFSNIS